MKESKTKDVLRIIFYPVLEVRRKFFGYRNKWLAKHNPKRLTEILYSSMMHGKKLNWDNPDDLNAKIQWLKFNGDIDLWARCADKFAVRQYVEERGCADLLVDFYGKWDRAEDIDWEALPNSFILKTNNGSGGNFICRDKSKEDIKAMTQKIHEWLLLKFSDLYVEPHYAKIVPCAIAEELLDAKCQDVESKSLVDYKVWCFDGKPLYIWVCHNREPDSVQVATYDTNWNYRPEKSVFTSVFRKSEVEIPKPMCLDKMLESASKLSKEHPEVRVDFYVVNNKCYFGEMTFTSLGGYMDFYSDDMLMEMGQMTNLSLARK